MKTKTFTTMGALHPVLFFAGIYMVALFFSIFICSSLFYSCNTYQAKLVKKERIPVEKQATPATSTAGLLLR